jgi:type IV pilus assembly protein PilM
MSVTLSISNTSIRLLSVTGRRVLGWGDTPLEPGLVKDGLILQPKAVGEAIDALFKSMKVSKEQVITSLTGLSFTYCILNLPQMKSALIEEAILRGARKEIPLPLEELYLSWQAIGGGQGELNFFVLGVPRNLVDTMAQTLEGAGVKLYIMDLKPLALARAADRGDALIVNLEPDCFDIVLVANGIPAIMHTITPRGEGAGLEDNIQRLTDGVSKTVNFYNNSHPETPFSLTTPFLLTGELSADAATSQLIQAQVEYPVELLVPPLEFPPDLPVALYTSNMGLALKEVPQKTVSEGDATGFHDINLNILSGKYRAQAHPLSMRYKLFSLALIIVVGLLFPLYYFANQATAENTLLQTELDWVSDRLYEKRLVYNEAMEIEDTINEITATADALKQEYQDILSKGGGFTRILRVVTNALPSETNFTSMELNTSRITVEGEADSSFAVISYAMALEAEEDLSDVRIAEIGEGGGGGVSFTIIIGKWD